MKRAIYTTLLGLAGLGAVIAASGGAQLYPVRLDEEETELHPAAPVSPSLVLAEGGIQFPDGSVQAQAAVARAPVEDTGQTECFTSWGAARECEGTGEDGEHQAGVAWPTPRFTINGDGTVIDRLTGLIWLQQARCFEILSWQEALDAANGLAQGQCGLADESNAGNWRLPNIKELLSLLAYDQSNPALPMGHPFDDVVSGWYWVSSTVTPGHTGTDGDTYEAWMVRLLDGHTWYDHKGSDHWVWAVRGGQ